jgi:hypothetical protein
MKPAQSKMAADAKQLLPRVQQALTDTGADGHQFVGASIFPIHPLLTHVKVNTFVSTQNCTTAQHSAVMYRHWHCAKTVTERFQHLMRFPGVFR